MTMRCKHRGFSRGRSPRPAPGGRARGGRWPECFRQDTLSLAHAAVVAGALVALGAVNATLGENATYAPDSRWFLPALFASLFGFYILSLTVRVASLPDAPAWAAGGLGASGPGGSPGGGYALALRGG